MTTKDKAIEIYNKYADILEAIPGNNARPQDIEKACMVAVDELIEMSKIHDNHHIKIFEMFNTTFDPFTENVLEYWEEVKTEILHI
jgi:hypothetical protein